MQNDLVNILKFWNKTSFLHVYTNLLEIGSCGLARGEALIESQCAFWKTVWKEIQLKPSLKIYFKDRVCVCVSRQSLACPVSLAVPEEEGWGALQTHTVFTFFSSSFKRAFLENILWLEVVAFCSQSKKHTTQGYLQLWFLFCNYTQLHDCEDLVDSFLTL